MQPFQALDRILLAPLGRLAAAIAELGSQVYDGLEWLYHLPVRVSLVEGVERHSHLPLCVLCGLPGQMRNYVLGLMFEDGYRRRPIGWYWLWNLPRAIAARPDCSMILTAPAKRN